MTVPKLHGFLASLLFFTGVATAQITEPYQPLHGGSFSGAPVTASADPLIAYRWDHLTVQDSLQIFTLEPVSVKALPAASFLREKSSFTVKGKGTLFFDFGVESAGWLEFDSDDLTDSVQMSISEYNEPAVVNTGARHPSKTLRPIKYGRTYRLELNDDLYEGVRFGWIHVSGFSKVWHIHNPRLVCQTRPVNYEGSFSCSDSLLNRIWYAGAYTVRLNLLRHYFGAILMERSDRQSWTGDAYPAQAAALAAFGNYDFIRANMRLTASQDNGIAAYPLYWVLSLIDYFYYTGDISFFKEYIANAGKKLESAYEHYDRLPGLGFMGWDERLGAGFEDPQAPEAQQTYRMLCIHAWNQFGNALLRSGDTILARKYLDMTASKTGNIQPASFGVHAVSEAVNAGLADNPAVRELAGRLFADRLNRLSYSPFNQCFIIQAMACLREYKTALCTIKDCWGGQLSYGGTSFFEVFRPSWNSVLNKNEAPPNNQCGYTSLCHPWGAAVTQWLSENILGIKPSEPGFKSFVIMPYLDETLTQVRGGMPTPAGTVSASFNRRTGETELVIPSGLTARKIGLPRLTSRITGMEFDNPESGQKYHWQINKNTPPPGVGAVGTDSEYVYLFNVQPGHYSIKLQYAKWQTEKTKSPDKGRRGRQRSGKEEPGFLYTVQCSQDSLHAGNWKKAYGKQGYRLFGYNEKDQPEAVLLPAYVEDLRVERSGVVIWDSATLDTRVLFPPGASTGRAAAIITNDPNPTWQTLHINVTLKKDHPYRLSLYFLDWDQKDRRSAVEIFDLKTLQILSPVQMIRNYQKGKYLCFTYNKSVRIRINQVRGQNAALSGIFFDPAGK